MHDFRCRKSCPENDEYGPCIKHGQGEWRETEPVYENGRRDREDGKQCPDQQGDAGRRHDEPPIPQECHVPAQDRTDIEALARAVMRLADTQRIGDGDHDAERGDGDKR